MDSTAFALLIVALAVGSVCKYRRINPALPLIAAGLIFDYFVPDVITELPDPEFILTLVLAPLVFAAALASSALDLRRIRRSVLLLAVVLVDDHHRGRRRRSICDIGGPDIGVRLRTG